MTQIHADFFRLLQGFLAKVFNVPPRSAAGLRGKKQGDAPTYNAAGEKAGDKIQFLI